MRSSAVGRRYGRALLDLATENGKAELVAGELETMTNGWMASPELRDVFQNPNVSSDARRGIVRALCDKIGASELVRNTLSMLSDRRRMAHLPEIRTAYEALRETRAGKVRAEVITALPMPEGYFTELQKTLETVTGKKVVIARREDPSLIAGVVTRVGDRVFDGSVRNRLDELKDELLSR